MSLSPWDSNVWPTYIFICRVPCPCLFLYHFICSLACSIKPLTYPADTCCQKYSPFLPSLLGKPISIRYCCYIPVISALQQILSLQSVWRLQMPNNVLSCAANWFQGCTPLSDCTVQGAGSLPVMRFCWNLGSSTSHSFPNHMFIIIPTLLSRINFLQLISWAG